MNDVPDPFWLDEHRYLTVWAGNVIEVDIRQHHPLRGPTEELLRASSIDLADVLRQAFSGDPSDEEEHG